MMRIFSRLKEREMPNKALGVLQGAFSLDFGALHILSRRMLRTLFAYKNIKK